MIWLALPLLILFSAAAFVLGRRRAAAMTLSGAGPAHSRPAHSRPAHHGAYAALWTATPALALLTILLVAGPMVEARAPGSGLIARPLLLVLAGVAALLGLGWSLSRISPELRARVAAERAFRVVLVAASATAVAIMAGIVLSLAAESLRFFSLVSPWRFLTGRIWAPDLGLFGAAPLLVGTLAVAAIALTTAGPLGLMAALFLSEYASPRLRGLLKPVLELMAGAPGVVWGLFAVLILGPAISWAFHGSASPLTRMTVTAGLAIGMMLLPFVTALSDDVLRAVPVSLRYASYATGATKAETVLRIVLPAAWPGVGAALLLAFGRAVGETMIVTMAAALTARAVSDTPAGLPTVTAQIVDLLHWDQDFDRPTTLAAYGLGLTLFLATLAINVAALRIVRAYGERHG